MKKSVVKLFLFFGLLAIPLCILSRITANLRTKSTRKHLRLETAPGSDTAWYFIGSSRVQMSVDTGMLMDGLDKRNIYNLGISGATFLTNCFVATELMKSDKPKVLFIELSVMLTEMAIDVFERTPSLERDMYATARTFFSDRDFRDRLTLSSEFANRYLSGKIFYYDQVRMALLNIDTLVSPGYGFYASPAKGFNSDESILRWEELQRYVNARAVSEYQHYFARLYDAARKSNTRIVFFIPLTFGSERERTIVIPVYNSIPEKDKLVISPALAGSLHDKRYLVNANHFNAEGARIYSGWLVRRLDSLRAAGYFNSLMQ